MNWQKYMSAVQEISTVEKRSVHELWKEIQGEIKQRVAPHVYSAWFEPISAIKIEHVTLTIRVPSEFFIEYIQRHYAGPMMQAVGAVLGNGAEVKVRVVEPAESKHTPQKAQKKEIVKNCYKCKKLIVLIRNVHQKFVPCEPGIVTISDDTTQVLDENGMLLLRGEKRGYRLHSC